MGAPHKFTVELNAAQLAATFKGLRDAGKLEANSGELSGVIATDGVRVQYNAVAGANLVTLTVLQKPFLAPASLVEKKLREALSTI